MWGHPGKKLLFMGQEFAQADEWSHERALPWELLAHERHAGVQRLVGDLNRLLREQPALHRQDGEAAGFEWVEPDDREHSVFAWLRHAPGAAPVLVVSNMTPVPRAGYRLGVPAPAAGGPTAWREVLNTDSAHYGGSNLGNGGAPLPAEPQPWQRQPASVVLTLPPLATLFLVPA
jgi:1,4-alpha-glucan branching enzyme